MPTAKWPRSPAARLCLPLNWPSRARPANSRRSAAFDRLGLSSPESVRMNRSGALAGGLRDGDQIGIPTGERTRAVVAVQGPSFPRTRSGITERLQLALAWSPAAAARERHGTGGVVVRLTVRRARFAIGWRRPTRTRIRSRRSPHPTERRRRLARPVPGVAIHGQDR